MKIIIVGCGKVGSSLAERLSGEGHEVTIVDKDGEKLKRIAEQIDVLGMEGNGVSYEVLLEAGIKDANLLITTTDSDEHNLLSCLFAKPAANCHTIARIRDPEYFNDMKYIREELNLSMVINPELAAAREITKLVKYPAALKVETFVRGRVDMLKLVLPKDTQLDGTKIYEISGKYKCNVLICAVERGDGVSIPAGDFTLQGGDVVWFIADHRDAIKFFKTAGVTVTNTIKTVMLIGGGKLSYYTAKLLEEAGISTKIIEVNKKRCEYLSEELPNTMIINGDGTDQQLLLEEGITGVDAIAGMTGIDEENIMLALYASSVSKAKVITKINRLTFEDVIKKLDLGSIINPKNVTADTIASYIRAMSNSMGSNVESMCKIASDKAEALEFRVRENSKVTYVPLKELKLKDNLLIAAISHNSKVTTPNGNSTIEIGDTVIVVTTQKGLNDIEDILK